MRRLRVPRVRSATNARRGREGLVNPEERSARRLSHSQPGDWPVERPNQATCAWSENCSLSEQNPDHRRVVAVQQGLSALSANRDHKVSLRSRVCAPFRTELTSALSSIRSQSVVLPGALSSVSMFPS
jgi:hypothetical protein